MRRANLDTIAYDAHLYPFTIPGSGSSPAALAALVNIPSEIRQRIVSWEILENAAAFKLGKDAGHGGSVLTRAGSQGWAPALGNSALDTWYARASAAGTVAAVLMVYLIEPTETVGT